MDKTYSITGFIRRLPNGRLAVTGFDGKPLVYVEDLVECVVSVNAGSPLKMIKKEGPAKAGPSVIPSLT
jgi:nucleoside-diphosphate-sugar epimerase